MATGNQTWPEQKDSDLITLLVIVHEEEPVGGLQFRIKHHCYIWLQFIQIKSLDSNPWDPEWNIVYSSVWSLTQIVVQSLTYAWILKHIYLNKIDWFDFWCFNATFSSISAISWRPVLVVEEAGILGENTTNIEKLYFIYLVKTAWNLRKFAKFKIS